MATQFTWAALAAACMVLAACGGGPEQQDLSESSSEAAATTSSYQGCYTDGSTRALPTLLMSSGATVENCIAAAKAKGLTYAGVQNAGQCFAGNKLGYTKVSDSECNAKCIANWSEICGGTWRNSIYTTTATSTAGVPSGLTATASANVVALSWTVVSGATSYKVYRATSQSGTYASINSSAVTSASYSDGAVTTGATYWYAVSALNSAGESARSSPVSATVPAAVSVSYQGCYTDDSKRALPTQLMSSGATVENCVAAAKAKGLTYAGLQNGGQCFAGNTLGYTKVSDSECNANCGANWSEKCGGAWRNSIYAASAAAPAPSPAPTPSPAPATIAVSIAPVTASVVAGSTQTFTATVTGTSNTAVNWSMQQTSGCGSVSSTGLYTAPGAAATCNVIATSQADSTKSATATVTVTATTPAPAPAPAPAPTPGTGNWSSQCAAEPMRTTGTTYYACDCKTGYAAGCKAGSDSNPGTDPRSPVQTMGKVTQLFRSMSAGDTVALCKGGVFDVSQGSNYSNFTCGTTPTTTCILRDYDPHCAGPSCVNVWGTGSEPKPAVTAFTGGQTGISLQGGASTPGSKGLRFLNVRFTSTLSPEQASGNGLVNDATWTDVEVCNCDFNGWGMGIFNNGGSCATITQRWKVRGNRITNSCNMGVLVDMSDTDFDGNYFDNNGHDACAGYTHILNPSGGTSHTFYWSSWCGGKGVKFINNEVHRNSYYNGGSIGSAVVTDSGQNFTVENNWIDLYPNAGPINGNKQYAGALFGGQGYGAGSGLVGLVVRRNRITSQRGRQIGYSSAPNAIIEDNVITLTGDVGDVDAAIVLPHNQGTSKVTSGGTVRNNTIYVNATSGHVGGVYVAGPSGGAGFNVTGNAVTYAGNPSGPCYTIGQRAWISYMNNNHCSNGSTWGAIIGGNSSDLAGWRTATGFDANSITAAPLFVNAPSNLTPAAGSPLIGTGSTATNCTVGGQANQSCSSMIGIVTSTWSATDSAKVRSAPDIGAYEQ